MSDVDQLESLSNQELRAKCLEYGLPNVPVTDSSRKVLIKKLRLILSDPIAAASKKANRRETIHVTRPTTPSKQSSSSANEQPNEERSVASRNNRRTIAATQLASDTVDDKIQAEKPAPITARRRSAAQKTITEYAATEENSKKAAATIKNEPTNVKERRRSVRDRESMEKLTPQTVAMDRPITIIEDEENDAELVNAMERRASAVREVGPQYAPSAQMVSPVLEAGSLVILESDEEDDADLLRAVERAEQHTKGTTTSRFGRGSSLSKSNTVTTSYAHAPTAAATSQQRELPLTDDDVRFPKPYASTSASSARNYVSPQPTVPKERSTYTGTQTQSTRHTLGYSATRYSSALPTPTTYSSPSYQRYSTSAATSTSSTSAAYKPSIYVNEQSDDTEADGDELNTPFLSSFARNLERIKAETITNTSIGSPRYRGSKLYDDKANTYARQSYKANDTYLMKLERKYHLRFFMLLAILLVVLVFFYVVFFN